jgi:hypothetical protein
MEAAAIIADLRRQAARCRETARHLSLKHEVEELISLARAFEAKARALEAGDENCLRKNSGCP